MEDLLKNFVPKDWVNQLDFTYMERVSAKFHADELKQREGDLIYRIQYKEGDGEIYSVRIGLKGYLSSGAKSGVTH